MIDYITGTITQLTPATVTIETGAGIGFLLNISLPVYTKLNEQGALRAKMYVHESIREDAWTLYGFLDESERQLFRLLIGVSGVGAATARIILSAIPTNDLQGIIARGESAKLKKVKGIGAKTAERIIVDLRDKIAEAGAADVAVSAGTNDDNYEEALAALVILGFPKAASQKVLTKIYGENPALKVDIAIKQALAML